MELTNEFSVSVPVDEAWMVLTDLERVTPCMPGFQLQEVEGEEYRGVVKVKVGPMTAQYKGVASFQERDEANRRAVVRAEGRETRGQGNAVATVTASLEPEGGGTRVTLHTDLTITGRVAQFGRGVIVDVSRKLLGEFVEALESDVLSGSANGAKATASGPPVDASAASGEATAARDGTPESTAVPVAGEGTRRIESASAEPVDLLATAGSSVMKRVGPVIVLIAVAIWLWLRD